MYVCICNKVTDRAIHQAARAGVRDFDTLSATLKVSSCCGKCENCAREVLREAVAHHDHAANSTVFPVAVPCPA